MKKRMLTMLLALMLIVSVIPFAASATAVEASNSNKCAYSRDGKHNYLMGFCINATWDGICLAEQCHHPEASKEVIPGSAATCKAAEVKAGEKCSACGEVLVAPESVGSPLKHKYTVDLGVHKNPTCTEDGLRKVGCSYDNCTEFSYQTIAAAHTPVEIPEVPANCTTAKIKAGSKCSVCETILVEPEFEYGTSLGHDYDEGTAVVTKEATCLEKGTRVLTCKTCGHQTVQEFDAIGHDYSVNKGYKEGDRAFCYKTGTFIMECSRAGCGYQREEVAPKIPCEQEEIPAVAPKCGVAGSTAGSRCKYCQNVSVEPQPVAALRHDYDEGVITTAPKCGDAGVKTITCKREGCGSYYTETIAALTHEYDSTVTTAPTCTKVGEETHVCKHCGLTVKTEVEATGHKITNDMATLIDDLKEPPTCQSEGKGKFRCQNEGCKAWSILKVPAVDHEYVTWPGFAATCTKTGRTDGEYCKYCKTDSVKTQRQVIPVLEHDYNVLIRTTKEATCLEAGSAVYKCFSDCNGYLELPVEKLGHDDKVLENWPATCTSNGCTKYECQREGCPEKIRYVDSKATGHAPETLPAVEATCSITGLTEGKQCATCQAILEAQTVIEKKAHTWTDVAGVNATCTENGYTSHKKCSVCGTVEGKSVIEASHYYNDVRCTVCGEANPEYVAPDHGDHDKDDHNKPGHGGNHGHPDFIDPDDNGDNKPDQGGNNVESEDKDDNKQPSQGGNNGGSGDKDHNHRVCKHEHQTTVTQEKTCTTNGSVISYCTDCETVITVTPDVATGHNFVMGACAVCGEHDPAVYTNDFNNYYIVGGSTK